MGNTDPARCFSQPCVYITRVWNAEGKITANAAAGIRKWAIRGWLSGYPPGNDIFEISLTPISMFATLIWKAEREVFGRSSTAGAFTTSASLFYPTLR